MSMSASPPPPAAALALDDDDEEEEEEADELLMPLACVVALPPAPPVGALGARAVDGSISLSPSAYSSRPSTASQSSTAGSGQGRRARACQQRRWRRCTAAERHTLHACLAPPLSLTQAVDQRRPEHNRLSWRGHLESVPPALAVPLCRGRQETSGVAVGLRAGKARIHAERRCSHSLADVAVGAASARVCPYTCTHRRWRRR